MSPVFFCTYNYSSMLIILKSCNARQNLDKIEFKGLQVDIKAKFMAKLQVFTSFLMLKMANISFKVTE